MKNTHTGIAILLLSTKLLLSQVPSVQMSLDTNSILIGDQVNLAIDIQIGPDYTFTWPQLSDTLTPDIEILSLSPVDTTLSENNILKLHQNLRITAFDSGFYQIPEIRLEFQNRNDSSYLITLSNPLYLIVNTLAVDTTKAIMPIKGPIGSPYTIGEAIPWILAALFVLALALFIRYYLKRKKQKKPVFAAAKPKIPAHVIALNGLEELRQKKLWQQGKFKQHYTELTDIIRIYMENRYAIDAMEMTSDEIMQAIHPLLNNENPLREKLTNTLYTADMVKFAKAQPLPQENDIHLKHMTEFVQQTFKTETTEEQDDKKILPKNAQIDNVLEETKTSANVKHTENV